MVVAGVVVAGVAAAALTELDLEGGPLVVGHHRHVDDHPLDAVEGLHGAGHPARDLRPQGAAGDRQRDEHGDRAAVDGDVADHVEVDDAAVQFGVLDGPQGLEDLLSGDGHRAGSRTGSGGFPL